MKSNKKLRVVIDTNVWLSGLVFGGQSKAITELFTNNAIEVVTSEELLSELRRIVHQKFSLFTPLLGLLEASIRDGAEVAALGSVQVSVSPDSDDDRVIETALIGSCGYIITGDQDLLKLKAYQGIQIIQPTKFLEVAMINL